MLLEIITVPSPLVQLARKITADNIMAASHMKCITGLEYNLLMYVRKCHGQALLGYSEQRNQNPGFNSGLIDSIDKGGGNNLFF